MTSANERLQKARRDAGFETASDAARFHGWNENTYRSHENGERGLRLNVVDQYARAFNVSSSWLLVGEGTTDGEMLVRVVGAIEREGVIHFFDGEFEDRRIVPPFPIRSFYKCFSISGDFLYPRYSDGDLVFTSPEIHMKTIKERTEGVIWTSAQAARFGFLYADTYKKYTLEMQGIRPTPLTDIYAFGPVELIIRQTQYNVTSRSKQPN